MEILPKPYVRTLTANLYIAGGGIVDGHNYRSTNISVCIWPTSPTKFGAAPKVFEYSVGHHEYLTGWSFSLNKSISLVIGAYQRVAFGIMSGDGDAASTYYAGYSVDTKFYTHLSGTLD